MRANICKLYPKVFLKGKPKSRKQQQNILCIIYAIILWKNLDLLLLLLFSYLFIFCLFIYFLLFSYYYTCALAM